MIPSVDANAARWLGMLVLVCSPAANGCLRFGYDALGSARESPRNASFDAGSSTPLDDGGSRMFDAAFDASGVGVSSSRDAGSRGSARDASSALDAMARSSDAAADSSSYVGTCMDQLPPSCRLDIVGSKVSAGPHANFPLLVSLQADWLRSAAMGGSVADTQGADLRFSLDNAGAAALAFEIERYDPALGALIAWVRMPKLESTSELYLLFGACAAQRSLSSDRVWQEYSGVWHLGDNRESTSQSADAVEEGSVPVVTGQIGSGRAFSTSNGALNVGSSTAIDDVFASAGFISTWINPSASSSGSAGRIASKVTPFSLNSNGWALLLDPNPAGSVVFRYYFSPNVGYWVTPSGSLPLGGWHHLVLQYSSAADANNPEIFVDGQPIGLGNGSAPSGTAIPDADSPMYIGNLGDGSRPFDGTIDELRLGRGTKSPGWISTEYNNQLDPAGFLLVTPP